MLMLLLSTLTSASESQMSIDSCHFSESPTTQCLLELVGHEADSGVGTQGSGAAVV